MLSNLAAQVPLKEPVLLPKPRQAKLWELSFQGTIFSPKKGGTLIFLQFWVQICMNKHLYFLFQYMIGKGLEPVAAYLNIPEIIEIALVTLQSD